MVSIEMKQIEEIPDGRTVPRYIRIISICNRVREIIPAAPSQRLQIPIPLDEFQNRDVIGVGVADVAAPRKARDHDQRYTWTVAKKIKRLDVSGVI